MVPTLIFLDFQLLFQQIQFRLHWTAASHSWGLFKVQNGSSKNAGLGVSGLWAVFVIGLEVSKSSVSNFETGGLRSLAKSRIYHAIPLFHKLAFQNYLQLDLASDFTLLCQFWLPLSALYPGISKLPLQLSFSQKYYQLVPCKSLEIP